MIVFMAQVNSRFEKEYLKTPVLHITKYYDTVILYFSCQYNTMFNVAWKPQCGECLLRPGLSRDPP